MKRFGLLHNGKQGIDSMWSHPSGKAWCIPLTNNNGHRVSGLWEVVHIDRWKNNVIDSVVPLTLKECARHVQAHATSEDN